jgi:hypothetical protein
LYILKMRPQYFPWLFDDKNAWEKCFSNPHYNYELPIENFMSLYQVERKVSEEQAGSYPVMPAFSMPLPAAPAAAPMPVAQAFTAASPFAAMPVAAAPAAAAAPKEEGILSQDEIDALLSGL